MLLQTKLSASRVMFVLVFCILFGSINFYVYRTVERGFPEASFPAVVIIALLFLSLFLAVYLERAGKLRASMLFSTIGYTWLGIAGLALVFSAITDAIQLFFPNLDDRIQAILVGCFTVGAGAVAAISARRFKIVRIKIESPKIPTGSRFRIVQISDLHLGDSSNIERTRRVVRAVNELEPDVVVSTGDLFDGCLDLMQPYVELLAQFEAPLGKFAVSGNHEVYAGLDKALELTKAAGFSVLRHEIYDVGSRLALVGVDDPAAGSKDESSLLARIDSDRFAVLLKHRPVVRPESVGRFDLQLSGHTHGGQIFPFHVFTKLFFSSKVGLTQIANGRFLYLSRGTGSWGPQLRLLAPCEVTVFEIS